MSDDAIQAAVQRFEIPPEHETFMFCLPAFYVAKADGSISLKEAMSIAFNSLMLGLVKPHGDEKKAFQAFAKDKLLQFQGKRSLDDFDVLAEAINAKLAQYPADAANDIRKSIQETCVKVAKASGPMFRDKVLPEERHMLDKIFAALQ
jgi:hypothetical protein